MVFLDTSTLVWTVVSLLTAWVASYILRLVIERKQLQKLVSDTSPHRTPCPLHFLMYRISLLLVLMLPSLAHHAVYGLVI